MAPSAPIQTETQTLIRDILETQFGRKALGSSLTPGSKNTSVYIVSVGPVQSNHVPSDAQASRPGTEPLPADATKVVLRFTNPDAYLNDAVLVQNEAAAITLFREALKPLGKPLVPRIYGWSPAVDGRLGWLLEEHMPGSPLGYAVFTKLRIDAKKDIVDQVAQIFRLIQKYQLPATVVGYGGLDFAPDGQIITGPTPIHGATKSCQTYHDLYLQTQLAFMDKCDIVQGWKDTNLRARIDDFVARGFQPLLERVAVTNPRQTLVHGDFDVQNLLFDPQTNRITALLDFGFSHVASVAEEYFYSFSIIGSLISPTNPVNPEAVLRQGLLHGFDTVTEEIEASAPMVDWKVARLTDEAFFLADVERPADLMPNIEPLANLYWFIQNISPGLFFLPRVRARMGPEKIAVIKKGEQEGVEHILSEWGF